MILPRPRLNKMTSPSTLGPEQQHLEGRSVRDIVEYSPAQVNEVWCRRIFRQILQSLELQYAMHMPHRAITPDTIVFHDNGEPLLTPLEIGPPDDREAEDLTALARVVHYAITQELVPAGPLHGRVDGYSDALLAAVDRCMDPDPVHRPQTIGALRELLGMVPPGAPVRAAAPHMTPGLPLDDDLAPPAADALAPDHAGTTLPDLSHAAVPDSGPMPTDEPAFPAAGTADTLHADGHDLARAAEHGVTDDAAHTADAARDEAPASPAPAIAATAPAAPVAAAPVAAAPTSVAPGSGASASAPPVSAPPVSAAPASPAAASAAHATAATGATAAAPAPRRGTGLGRRQRWALAAGGAALVALVLATVAEMRDSGPFDHIDLAAPRPVQDAAAPGAAPLPAGTPPQAAGSPVAGGTAPVQVPAGEGTAAGLGPGETLIQDSAAPAQPPLAQGQGQAQPQPRPLPGVVVTPNGNVYRLQIQPWGVVYVDGVDRGVSPPVKRLTLTPGRHTIRVTNPNFHERVLDIDTATGNGVIAVDFTEGSR
jgi:hypothetical protein